MVSGRNESKLSQKNLEIKQDDKFFTRIMSKDTSMANSSTRVYYGGASGSVPFMWESRPGTPKHTFSDTSNIPPLTPPPSYFSRSKSKSKQNSLFPRFRKKSTHVSPSPSMSSSTITSSSFSTSSSSTSWSSFHSSTRSMSTFPKSRKRLCFTCSSSSIHDNEEDDEEDNVVDKEERAFGLCASKLQRNGVNKGRYLMKNMKNAFFAIIGHGSS